MEKITAEDIRIERMKDCHDVSDFKSYEKDLMAFLADDALANQKNIDNSADYMAYWQNCLMDNSVLNVIQSTELSIRFL